MAAAESTDLGKNGKILKNPNSTAIAIRFVLY